MKRKLFQCMVVCFALLFSLTFGEGVTFSAEKPIALKLIRSWAKNLEMNAGLWEFVNRVNSRAKGRLEIQDVGGAEVAPIFEQLGMLKAGVADLVATVPAYIAGQIPEANAFYFNFGANLEELRAAGLYDKVSEIMQEKVGSFILGGNYYGEFFVFIRKPIKNLGDFKGLKLRSLSMYDPVFKGLGAATVTIPSAETYSALEKGVVDGMGIGDLGIIDQGFTDIVKYTIHPAFWRYPSGFICMRTKSFDSLPGDLKDLLKATAREVERDTPAIFKNNALKERDRLDKAGVKQIWLSENEWRKVQEIQWENGLKSLLLDPCPKYGQELKQLMSRFYPPKEPFLWIQQKK